MLPTYNLPCTRSFLFLKKKYSLEVGSHVAQDGLKLAMQLRMTMNFGSLRFSMELQECAISPVFMGCWNTLGKHLTDWATSPAPRFIFKGNVILIKWNIIS